MSTVLFTISTARPRNPLQAIAEARAAEQRNAEETRRVQKKWLNQFRAKKSAAVMP